MKIVILIVSILIHPSLTIASEIYPSLLEVKIGKPFNHPQGSERKDKNRPTTQFKVPNYGPTSKLFPEFSIAILNSTEIVSIITAETVLIDISVCEDKKEQVLKWAHLKFPNHKSIALDKTHLNGNGEYGLEGSNMYFILKCYASYGPFWSIHFQMRGIEEDELLKNAWSEFFKN